MTCTETARRSEIHR